MTVGDMDAGGPSPKANQSGEEGYRDLLSSLPVGILIHSSDCRIEYANRAALEMLGLPEESVCGHTVFEAASLAVREDGLPFPPEDHPGAVALATGRPVAGVVLGFYRPALQDRAWLLVSAQPEPATATAPQRVILTLTDLTPRRQAEERQRESEARYRQLIEKAQDIFYRTDLHGRFTYVNPMASRFIGYTEDELLGKHFMELVHPDHRQRVSEALLDQFRRRLRNTYDEFVAVTHDGKALWVGQNVQLLMDGDRVIGFQAAARDVTERKRVEEALEQERRRLQQIVDAAQPPRRTRPRPVVAVPTRPRVLVAEDNPINRKVALSMLEHLGYRAEVVVNGLEAVEACARSTYDAILMDCQMPVLDGLRATAWIRQREGRTRRTPIIALTADTLSEDRQRCFAAGMDDFLSKPVTLAVLRDTLARWVEVRQEPEPEKESVGASLLPPDHPLRVLESQGRQALVREVLELFLQTTPVRLEALRQMGVEADAGAFLTLCHSLKGAALQLGAVEMADHCTRLEAALRRGDRAEAEERLGALGEAFERERQRLEPQRTRLHGSAAAS
jgi:PAS domain S-box-containing protein